MKGWGGGKLNKNNTILFLFKIKRGEKEANLIQMLTFIN